MDQNLPILMPNLASGRALWQRGWDLVGCRAMGAMACQGEQGTDGWNRKWVVLANECHGATSTSK